jgi:hypothetical protein
VIVQVEIRLVIAQVEAVERKVIDVGPTSLVIMTRIEKEQQAGTTMIITVGHADLISVIPVQHANGLQIPTITKRRQRQPTLREDLNEICIYDHLMVWEENKTRYCRSN